MAGRLPNEKALALQMGLKPCPKCAHGYLQFRETHGKIICPVCKYVARPEDGPHNHHDRASWHRVLGV